MNCSFSLGSHLRCLAALIVFWAGCFMIAPASADIVYPHDGTSYNVDLVRQFDMGSDLGSTATATYVGTASQAPANPGSNAINGHLSDAPWRIVSSAQPAEDADAAGELVVDLGEAHEINRVRTLWVSGQWPQQYAIGVSEDNNAWTEVVPLTAVGDNDITDTFATRTARYVKLTAKGLDANVGKVGPHEFFVMPALTDTAPMISDGLDIGYLVSEGLFSVSVDENMQANGDGLKLFGGNAEWGIRGRNTATADGVATIDLGQQLDLYRMNLIFSVGGSKNWQNGGKVEVSADGIGWTELLDTGSAALGHTDLTFDLTRVQYIRLTNKYVAGVGTSTNKLECLELFGQAIPEPATMSVLLIGAVGLLRRRLN